MSVIVRIRKTTLIIYSALMVSVILAGCSGMTPTELRNNREEGPEQGLFSGAQAEFVIFRTDEAAKSGQAGEKSKTLEQ